MFQNLPRSRYGYAQPLRNVVTVLGLVLASLLACFVAVEMSTIAQQPAMQLRGAIDAVAQPPAIFSNMLVNAMATVSWKTVLLVIHVAGLVAGFGAALFLDILLLQHLYNRPVTQPTVETVAYGQRMVTVGLTLLWISGLGFLALYYFTDPTKLANPKLWAKLTIVSLLTLNGMLIHALVAPRLSARLGEPLLKGVTLRGAALPLVAAAISGTSWLFAALLGLVREMNDVVSGNLIMLAYCSAVLLVLLGAVAMHLLLAGPVARPSRHKKILGEII